MRMVSCPENIRLSEAEIASLKALPEFVPGWAVERVEWCELETEHPGPHYAAVATLQLNGIPGSLYAWARWATGVRDFTNMSCCPEESYPGEVRSDCCTLQVGHVGRHRFEF